MEKINTCLNNYMKMDSENKSSVKDDPLLNRISESTDDSEGVATQLPSAASQRHDFLFKVNVNT